MKIMKATLKKLLGNQKPEVDNRKKKVSFKDEVHYKTFFEKEFASSYKKQLNFVAVHHNYVLTCDIQEDVPYDGLNLFVVEELECNEEDYERFMKTLVNLRCDFRTDRENDFKLTPIALGEYRGYSNKDEITVQDILFTYPEPLIKLRDVFLSVIEEERNKLVQTNKELLEEFYKEQKEEYHIK